MARARRGRSGRRSSVPAASVSADLEQLATQLTELKAVLWELARGGNVSAAKLLLEWFGAQLEAGSAAAEIRVVWSDPCGDERG